jgi:UDP-glucose 4-epimerase
MNVLITGGAGFIGTCLKKALIKLSYNVTSIDISYNKNEENLKEIHVDIRKPKSFKKIENQKFDIIFHLAAQTSGLVSEENPKLDFETNILGTSNVVIFAKKVKAKKIIFSSSMAVYGNPIKTYRVNETSKLNPASNYGVSKLAGEKILLKSNIDYTILRLFNVYGPGQNLGNLKQGMLSIFLAQYIFDNQIKVTGSLDRFRDFVYIDDVVQTFLLGLDDKTSKNIYNVGSEEKTSVRKLLNLINGLSKNRKKIIELGGHHGDTFGIYSSSKKIKKIGWENKIDLKNGLKKTYKSII